MNEFFNKRIEQVLPRIDGSGGGELYKGRNQIIFTGGIDDLFLISCKTAGKTNGDASSVEETLELFSIEEAVVECGKKRGYDLIITVKEDFSLEFAEEGQEKLFCDLTSESAKLPPGKTEKKLDDDDEDEDEQDDSPARTQAETDRQAKMQEAVQSVDEEGKKSTGLNNMGRITRALKKEDKRVLVIYPYPEKMLLFQNATTMRMMEIITKDWRNINKTAHPDSRSVLIINPHRMKDFQNWEHIVSCYDHYCQIVTILPPDRDEMKTWLERLYAPLGNILAGQRNCERVVLAGKAQPNANLQNFVAWVQGFYLIDARKPRKLEYLLKSENADASESKEDILQRLDRMIGLDEVKKTIRDIVEKVQTGVISRKASYHMLFLGSPGTGKTVVAELIAKLFWAMELRTSRTTVSIKFHDIVGEHNAGEAVQRMKAKIDEAMGGVLFVDEVYLFAESEQGKKAFQVLLTEMENHRDNLTVILASYANRLPALNDINEGFESRIPYKLYFPDYTKEQRLEIFKIQLEEYNKEKGISIKLDKSAEPKLLRILERIKGNARGVREFLNHGVLEKMPKGKLKIEDKDINDPYAVNEAKIEEIRAAINNEFIGMDKLKEQLEDFIQTVKFNAERSEKLKLSVNNRPSYRLRFTGPPGTGKTSIARHMGKFFHAMGITETDECRECGATTLKGAYVGHAQQAVNRLFHENSGKVIFIDEIYSLYNPSAGQDDSFGREAIDTLVRCLTAEEYRDTVVIVAGYKDKVADFMKANPGLASRIPDEIEFPDYNPDECVSIFQSIAKDSSYTLVKEAEAPLKKLFELLCEQDDFGNARTVHGVFEQATHMLVSRVGKKMRALEAANADNAESSGQKRTAGKTQLSDRDYTDILKEDISPLLDMAQKKEKQRQAESKKTGKS